MRKRTFATGGSWAEAGDHAEVRPWKSGIDTRLVAAVQARAGSRVHEAAGLLNSYYLWSGVLAQADRTPADPMRAAAVDQLCQAKRRLKEFLARGAWASDPNLLARSA